MAPSTDWYQNNPLIHRDRRLGRASSAWVRSFACEDLKPLIVCRGPIRKEAMDVFEEMGITHYGILLSEKDSITYANALAPELRQLTDTSRVHRVPDYTGASKEERVERMNQIVGIAKVARTAYQDPTTEEDWSVVEVAPVKRLRKPVALATIKAHPELSKMALVKRSRISVVPVTEDELALVLRLAETKL